MSELQVRKVVARYDGAPVLRGVSLTVPSGHLAAVLGPSGSGKSTLLRVIAGLHTPIEGAVLVDGQVITGPRVQVAPEHRRVGLVPQDAALFPHLDALGNIGFGLPRGQRRGQRALELLDLVGLGGLGGRMPGELSGGQRHRIALARALAPEPRLVLLDEPFSSLDASLRGELRAQVRQVLRLTGTTGVLVTHDQDEALSMADEVAVLDEGRMLQTGPPAEVYESPRSPWLARFVGGAVVLSGVWRRGRVSCPLGEVEARLADGEIANSGDRVEIVLRPEQLSVAAQSTKGAVAALIRKVAYFGHDAVLTLDIPGEGEPVEARVLGSRPWAQDSQVWVSVLGQALAFSSGPAGPRR